ncbi:MAG: citrate/2-methylcitrate synthase [Alkalispirochaetaceae bacterium]
MNSLSTFLDTHTPFAERQNFISPELHKRFNTKRGLRNDDGTGVLIGLTEIGEVRGYIIDDQERVPAEGLLLYRGYDLRDLVAGFQKDNRFGFEEIAYLLLFGALPNREELTRFQAILGDNRPLPENFTENMILRNPSNDIMNKLARSVLCSYSYDDNAEDLSVRNTLRQSIELIARFPTMVAYGFQAKSHYYDGTSLFLHAPDPTLSTAENLLQLIRISQEYSPLEAETLDLALCLHAEHGGGNNSAFTVHVVTSAATDTYSAIGAAVGSLKGAKHGGANAKVVAMIEDIKRHVSDWSSEKEVGAYLRKILRKEAYDRSGLIYGLGHAVYTVSDPRALLLKAKASQLAAEKEHSMEFALYELIERIAPGIFQEEKNTDRPICANVDFYSGFVYKILGIPPELNTPIFAVARVAGWCAHRIEEMVSGGRIIRPAYKNVVGRKSYISMAERHG